MRLILMLLLVTAMTAMTGCSASHYGYVKSSGMVAWNQRLTSVRLEVQPVTRVAMDITKMRDPNPSNPPPQVTESDRFATTEKAKDVIGDFQGSMKLYFPTLAKKYGLPVHDKSDDQSVLKLTVSTVKSICYGARKCDVHLRVNTEVIDSNGASIWNADVAYQPIGPEKVMGFLATEDFMRSLVATMKRDKLLPE